MSSLLSHLLSGVKGGKVVRVEDALNMLATGFLKGGTGFLKSSTAGEMIKGSGSVNREIRVGVTHVGRGMYTQVLI